MNTKVLAAAQAVVEAARENMDTCVSLVSPRPGWPKATCCGAPALCTINSNAHPACFTHAAIASRSSNSVFEHRQKPLALAIEVYDQAIADAAREALGAK